MVSHLKIFYQLMLIAGTSAAVMTAAEKRVATAAACSVQIAPRRSRLCLALQPPARLILLISSPSLSALLHSTPAPIITGRFTHTLHYLQVK